MSQLTPDDLEDIKETVERLAATVALFLEDQSPSKSVTLSVYVSGLFTEVFKMNMSKADFFLAMEKTWEHVEIKGQK